MYDQSKDKLIKLFEFKKDDKKSFLCSIFSYDGGIPKISFSKSYEKKDGTIAYSSNGRLTLDEIVFLKDNLEEIIGIMKEKS